LLSSGLKQLPQALSTSQQAPHSGQPTPPPLLSEEDVTAPEAAASTSPTADLSPDVVLGRNVAVYTLAALEAASSEAAKMKGYTDKLTL
jgi:hypothetical protein